MGKTQYIVKTAAAAMPNKCWGEYRRVAVLEVDVGVEPSMISERARGVHRVVATWERLNVGKTEKCAYARAIKDAEEMASALNDRQGGNHE